MASLHLETEMPTYEQTQVQEQEQTEEQAQAPGQKAVKVKAKRKRDIPRVWTPDEDERLRLAVSVHGTSRWKRISLDVGRRTGDQCCQRWMRALR